MVGGVDAKELRAPIFNIVHGSFVDGWGTRTTIFLKGCPLTCVWCCNPEGQKTYPELRFTQQDCNGCGKCVAVCPKQAIHMDPEKHLAVVDRSQCDDCLACTKLCETSAMDVFGKYYSVKEIFDCIARDERYFGSDGGLTIGGGEATYFPDFTLELIRMCHDNYIHVALDTCGFIETENGKKCLEEADLVLFDLKGMDDAQHRINTGVSNQLIHENLRYRDSLGKDIIVRVPIIPGYNASEENLNQTADFLKTLSSVRRVDLLPVHKYGMIKYEQLGMDYAIADATAYSKEEEAHFLELFRKRGLNVQIGG